ncbi:MAG: hypothetical protein LBT10_00555 [Methanobrevibacter sp.]|nr:hypothetical protein [Methanobrevibacter sp.]
MLNLLCGGTFSSMNFFIFVEVVLLNILAAIVIFLTTSIIVPLYLLFLQSLRCCSS